MSGFIDLSGQRFGRWTVLERADDYIRKDGKKDTCYKCLCDCGNEKIIRARYLTCGNSKSCGCYRSEYERNRKTTHGMTNTRIFKIWDGMINRCRNKRENTKHWNGKGINVCDEWQGNNGFINFYNWSMANGYEDSLTIDRKDEIKTTARKIADGLITTLKIIILHRIVLFVIKAKRKQLENWQENTD